MSNKQKLRKEASEKIKDLLLSQKETTLAYLYIYCQESMGIDQYYVDRVLQPYIDGGYFLKHKRGSDCVIENITNITFQSKTTDATNIDSILTAKPAGREGGA